MKTYTLTDAHESAKEHPDSFFLPPPELIEFLGPGHNVKLIFNPTNPDVAVSERMWVEIESRDGNKFTGHLNNTPISGDALVTDDELIEFTEANIINIWTG